MEIRIHGLFLLALAMLIAACGGEHSHESAGLELNDGEKWEANPETNQGIANMTKIVDSYRGFEDESACTNLKEDLEYEYQLIFERCTMEGKAHEQLHAYLLPLKEQMERLNTAGLEECREAYANIEDHLAMYSEYFR